MFWIRYQASNGTTVETALQPAPAAVEYPEKRAQKVIQTVDGAVVVQRAVRDPRPRKWLWRGYGPQHSTFATLWSTLEQLDARYRLQNSLPVTVEVWEDTSGAGGLDRMENGSRKYTKVRVLQVDRTPRKGGGPVIYDAEIVFHIDDTSYTAF